MKTYILLICAGLMISSSLGAQAFDHYRVSAAGLDTFEIHVTRSDTKEKRPLLIYLDGSGNLPLFYKTKSGNTNTSVAMDLNKYARDYSIVLISKPGTPFRDSMRYDERGRMAYPRNEKYTSLYSLDWRAGAASAAIDYLMDKLPIDPSRIIVMGFSEGSQVAPRVAVLNRKVTHVVSVVGNALPQLYDFILEARLQAERKEITSQESQEIVDSLYQAYESIFLDPSSTTKTWYGETYLKWSSFNRTSPLENMLQLSIPILYIAAGKDHNQTILDMDYARLEFIRKGKKNLTYQVYPDADHYFDQDIVENGVARKQRRLDEMNAFVFDWLARH